MFVTTASCCKRRYTMNRKNIWMALFGTVGLFGLNMGFLGVHGGGHADHGRDECSLFGHEAPEESDRRDQKRLTGRQHGQFILCFYRTAFLIQKSGLKSSAFRPNPFPRILSKSCRHAAVPNRFSSRFSTSRTNGPRLLSRVKMAHTRLVSKDRTQRLTRRNVCAPIVLYVK